MWKKNVFLLIQYNFFMRDFNGKETQLKQLANQKEKQTCQTETLLGEKGLGGGGIPYIVY